MVVHPVVSFRFFFRFSVYRYPLAAARWLFWRPQNKLYWIIFHLCYLRASVLFISFRFFYVFFSFLFFFFCFASFLTILFSFFCVSFFCVSFRYFSPFRFFSFLFVFYPFLSLQVPYYLWSTGQIWERSDEKRQRNRRTQIVGKK